MANIQEDSVKFYWNPIEGAMRCELLQLANNDEWRSFAGSVDASVTLAFPNMGMSGAGKACRAIFRYLMFWR